MKFELLNSSSLTEELRLTRYLPLLLSAVAGTVDVIGFMSLKLFTAHVTGNLVVVAASVVRGGPPSADQILAIPIFILAVAGVWLIAALSHRRGRAAARILLLIQLALLACAWILSMLTHPDSSPRGLAANVTAMVAVSAMASQYALLLLAIPEAPSTAVMTGNLARAVLALLETQSQGRPLLKGSERQLRRNLALIIVFFISCLAGATAFRSLGNWAWLLPVALAAIAVAVCPPAREARLSGAQ